MYGRILVPLDGSRHAEQALPDAVRLACASGGTVILLRVMRPLAEYEVAPPSPGVWLPAADDALRDAAAAYLTEVRARAALEAVATEARILVGPVAPTIIQAADEAHADIIVMSTHGRRGLARWLQGSVAGAVIRDARVPVLVPRDGGDALASITGASHPVSALVPLDGSPLAEAALVPALHLVAALSQPSGATLHLLRVVEPPPEDAAALSFVAQREQAEHRREVRQELRVAREYLEATATWLRERYADALGVAVTWSVGRGDDVAATILRAAELAHHTAPEGGPQAADLIAMATHGRGGLRRWLMGSVAERLVRDAPMPVLVVRPGSSDRDAVPRLATAEEVAGEHQGDMHLA